MATQNLAYLYAIAASVCFSTASLFFASYSQKISSLWMNFFKTTICFLCLSVSMLFVDWQHIPLPAVAALLLSGLLGLGLGDLFLLQAFSRMGSGRTLILFGFQPLIMGISSWYLFQQEVSLYKFIAVFFFLVCLYLFSLEKFKEHGHWEVAGLLAALLGVIFDSSGILLTRWSFNSAGEMGVLQANFIRTLGALFFYMTFNPFLKSGLFQHFNNLTVKQKWTIVIASAAGTFVSLVLYLSAIRMAHLASLSAIAVFSPLYSTSLELFLARKRPSIYLILAMVSFIIGFVILILF